MKLMYEVTQADTNEAFHSLHLIAFTCNTSQIHYLEYTLFPNFKPLVYPGLTKKSNNIC